MSQKKPEEQKICFVVMPISDVQGYDIGHFKRVYEHLLKPAIIEAGYVPVRADDTVKTDYIVVDIVKRIVESEMVLCDFSARNPNVMYELGLRHAFNKKVVLINDKKTDRIFDIQGLRSYNYDDSLRVDTVQKDKEEIKKSILTTAEAEEGSVNSVVQLAGIHAAPLPKGQEVSADTRLLLGAISEINGRITVLENNIKPLNKFPKLYEIFPNENIRNDDESKVTFEDGTSADLGDDVYVDGKSIGKIKSIQWFDDHFDLLMDTRNGAQRIISSAGPYFKRYSAIPY